MRYLRFTAFSGWIEGVTRHVTSSDSSQTRARGRKWRKEVSFSFSGHGEVSFLCSLSTATPAVSINMGSDNDDLSPPPTPPNPVPPGYFSASFERLVRENEMADWASAFTLFGGCFPNMRVIVGLYICVLVG